MLNADATEKLLRDFGRWCALQVVYLWDAPDVVRQYLETGDESLRKAARDAAWEEASWEAARAAARDAAWAAARDAARAAAWDAARAAANTAWAAAWAAESAAESAAAWAAARDTANTARAAALDKYGAELERRALIAMGLEQH
jgi:hypothetical protein